jgi:hypothetical protein
MTIFSFNIISVTFSRKYKKLLTNRLGRVGEHLTVLIVGCGPVGLRTAIECALLGARTIVVEKRTQFTRNNVLHLWSFLLNDFKSLGAKKFYGKFASGSIDHINIRTLQGLLLKVCLLFGVEFHFSVGFNSMVEPQEQGQGWCADFDVENHELNKINFDIVVDASGKKNVLPGFKQIEMRGALAIGITCNFVNNCTPEENKVEEISGIAYQFKPAFFEDMYSQHGVKLENIVYYKDETHYFVMTATKGSLLQQGVILKDDTDPARLLHPSNVSHAHLETFTRKAINYCTNNQLPWLEFKTLSNGKPDIAMFDFTSIKKSAHAARIVERHQKKLLMALVGDSLVEPFWPTGSGMGRGVLSALDTAWTIRQFALGKPPLAILLERENIFKLLPQTGNDTQQANFKAYTINPSTRYKALTTNKVSNLEALKQLYDTDDLENADLSLEIRADMPVSMISPTRKTARKRLSSGKKRSTSHLPSRSQTAHAPNRRRSRSKDVALSDDPIGAQLAK